MARTAQGFRLGQVELTAIAGDHVAEAGQRALQFAAKLAGGAGEQNLHAKVSA
jgi:hypothetical protein